MVQFFFTFLLIFLTITCNNLYSENPPIIKKITNPDAQEFPAPEALPDLSSKINEIQEILKKKVETWKSNFTPVPYEISSYTLLKTCSNSHSRTDSLDEATFRERKLDILFAHKEDFPEDAHLILGRGVALIEYNGKNASISSLASTLKIQCIPTRVIIEGGKVFYHEGDSAFKNYDSNPAQGRVFKAKDKGPRWSKRK